MKRQVSSVVGRASEAFLATYIRTVVRMVNPIYLPTAMLMLIMYDLVLISLSLQDGVIKTLQRFEEQGKLHFPSGEDI